MNYFAAHGDKVLAFLTAASAFAVTQAQSLGFNEAVISWVTFGSGLATLAHTIFFPNTNGPTSGKS